MKLLGIKDTEEDDQTEIIQQGIAQHQQKIQDMQLQSQEVFKRLTSTEDDEGPSSKRISTQDGQIGVRRDPTQDELLGDGDYFSPPDDLKDFNDEQRIKETVEKLQKVKEKKEASIKAQRELQAIEEEDLDLDFDSQLKRDFTRLHQKLSLMERQGPKLPNKLEPLDLTVVVVFDENLIKMEFPHINEIEFRVNRNKPMELAAKVVAHENGHPELWQDYQFTFQQ